MKCKLQFEKKNVHRSFLAARVKFCGLRKHTRLVNHVTVISAAL